MDRMKAFREITRAVGGLNRIAAQIRDNDEADNETLVQQASGIASDLIDKLSEAK